MGCSRSDPLQSTRIDCAGGVSIFARSAAHCVYDPSDAPEECPNTLPHRYETGRDVVCSEVDDLTDEWLAQVINASFAPEDDAVDSGVSEGEDAVAMPDASDGEVPFETGDGDSGSMTDE